jgi:CrcB protein
VTPSSSRPRTTSSSRRRPGSPDWRWLLLILFGGALGTAVRAWLESTWPAQPGAWPWTTFWINIAGSLLLGLLLEGLAISGPDAGWRRGVRLCVGTGVMGGFTTYSTFAVESVERLGGGQWLVGAAYALVSVMFGILSAIAGLRLGRTVFSRLLGEPA